MQQSVHAKMGPAATAATGLTSLTSDAALCIETGMPAWDAYKPRGTRPRCPQWTAQAGDHLQRWHQCLPNGPAAREAAGLSNWLADKVSRLEAPDGDAVIPTTLAAAQRAPCPVRSRECYRTLRIEDAWSSHPQAANASRREDMGCDDNSVVNDH